MNNIYNEIKYVVNNSRYVKINYQKLSEFISNFGIPNYKHWFADFDLNLDEKEKILLVFIIESLNFCFWQKPKYKVVYHNEEVKGSEALFLRIIDEVENNKNFLDINYLYHLSFEEFQNIFSSSLGELSMIDTRYKLFVDTVSVICEKGDKFYEELFDIKSDYELLNYIICNFKYFDDCSEYKNKVIHFNKRATLLVNDLFYMSDTINKNIKNVNSMFGCADYGIPRTLRTYDILEYNDELSNMVDNEIEIEQNSEMEIEIRANMLYALEIMKKELQTSGKIINSIELDNLIWQMGRKKKNVLPYHHTTTIFY